MPIYFNSNFTPAWYGNDVTTLYDIILVGMFLHSDYTAR